MLTFHCLSVLFNAIKTFKISITPYGDNFNYLTYRVKIKNLQGYIFYKVFYLKEFMGWTSGFSEITETPTAHFCLLTHIGISCIQTAVS